MNNSENKVLIIPSWYPTNSNEIVGSFFKEQAELLSGNGWDVKVLLGIFNVLEKNEPIVKKGRVRSLLDKAIRHSRSLSPGHPIISLQLQTDQLLQSPDAYSFTITLPFEADEVERFKLAFDAYNSALEAITADGWKPDIIHAQSTLEAGIFAHSLSRHSNIPFVIIEHQVFLLNCYSPYKQQLVLNALSNAKHVGVVSEHQKKMVLMNQPDCYPVVILNLVNETRFRLGTKQEGKPFTIVTITYPSPIKDFKTFFKAIKELSLLCEDFRFIVIGNDSFFDISKADSNTFIAYSKELGIHHLGKFIPHLKRAEIADILTQCDLFVSTSIAETFGVAAREAMMCGLPVVTTACGGIEDSITADTGITVPIRDHKAIAKAILEIKNNKQQYNSQKIRDFAISQFGNVSFLKSMNEFYSFGKP